MSTENQKIWLITGASKGLGLYLTRLLLSQGHKVIATSRNTDALEKENLKEKRTQKGQTHQVGLL